MAKKGNKKEDTLVFLRRREVQKSSEKFLKDRWPPKSFTNTVFEKWICSNSR